MITIIHGDDVNNSRKKLNEIRSALTDTEIVALDGRKATLEAIVLATESSSLFSPKKTIIIENLISKAKSAEKDKILEKFAAGNFEHDLVIWENKSIDKRTLKKYFTKMTEFHFELPAILFRFLGQLGKGNNERLLTTYHQLLAANEAEFIYVMILWQWRQLIIARDLGAGGFAGKPAWQTGKLTSQAKQFTLEELIHLYRQLVTYEYKIKIGLTPFTIKHYLDIFLATL